MTRHPSPARQRGVALAVVLILLLVMTLLVLASIRGTLLKERMSANMLDRSLAFQATEAALREGEALAAKPGNSFPASGCSDGLCARPAATDAPRWLAAGFWDDASGNWRETTVQVGSLTVKPRFIVERLDDTIPAHGSCTTSVDVSPEAACSGSERRFRITARSEAAGRAVVMLQSIYAVP